MLRKAQTNTAAGAGVCGLTDEALGEAAGGLDALQRCLDQEAYIGASGNRLEFTSSNLTTSSEIL